MITARRDETKITYEDNAKFIQHRPSRSTLRRAFPNITYTNGYKYDEFCYKKKQQDVGFMLQLIGNGNEALIEVCGAEGIV